MEGYLRAFAVDLAEMSGRRHRGAVFQFRALQPAQRSGGLSPITAHLWPQRSHRQSQATRRRRLSVMRTV